MATVEQARKRVADLQAEAGRLHNELAKVDADLQAAPAGTLEEEVRRLEPLTVRKMAILNLERANERALAAALSELQAAEAQDKKDRAAAANAKADALMAEVRELVVKGYALAEQAADLRMVAGGLEGWQGANDGENALDGLRRVAEACGARSYRDGPSGRYSLKWGDS